MRVVRRPPPPLRSARVAAFTAALLATAAASALADGDRERGAAFARTHCARCHAVAGPGPSPVAEAPPFSSFARRWPVDTVGEALAEGIDSGHSAVRMPQFDFTVDEIDDLIAYFRTIQR
ncbi:MAG: cytochrome c [Alphaproteobacteria bacterium]|nr:cytochrome c [Alphaproteobacteria bacterium]